MIVSVAESLLVQAMLHHVGLVCACGELMVRALASSPWQGVVQAFKVRAVIVVELLWHPCTSAAPPWGWMPPLPPMRTCVSD